MPYSDPGKAKEAKRRYALAHKDEINAKKRDRYATDPEYKAKVAAQYADNKEKILSERKAAYDADPEAKKKLSREYYEAHKEECAEYHRQRREQIKADPERHAKEKATKALSFRAWQIANREKLSIAQASRRAADPEKFKAQQRAQYAKNPEGNAARERVRRANDIEAYRAYRREYQNRMWRENIQFHMRNKLRNRVKDALKNGWKSMATMDLIGCPIEVLIDHIQSLFTVGMSWDLVMTGRIHIDHKKPCASFDLADPEQQKLCFHYSNLQPLWALDNLRKQDKYEGEIQR